jgi:RNA polymerase sigma-70 factor (ECF subfamily)
VRDSRSINVEPQLLCQISEQPTHIGTPWSTHSAKAVTDHDLVLAVNLREPWAAAEVVRRYRGLVRVTVTRWIGYGEVDDLTQEVFACFFERVSSLQQPGALKSFLVGITLRTLCVELRRRRRARSRITATGELPEPDDYFRRTATDDLNAREVLSRLLVVLDRLSPDARHVFLLRYLHGLELVDLAAEMGVSLSTAKRHVARTNRCVAAMVAREPSLSEYASHRRALRPPPMADQSGSSQRGASPHLDGLVVA